MAIMQEQGAVDEDELGEGTRGLGLGRDPSTNNLLDGPDSPRAFGRDEQMSALPKPGSLMDQVQSKRRSSIRESFIEPIANMFKKR